MHEFLAEGQLACRSIRRTHSCLCWCMGGSLSPRVLQAARDGDVERVRTCVAWTRYTSSSTAARDLGGRTALIWAAALGRKAIVDFLLVSGAEVDAADVHKTTGLLIASKAGHLEVVRLLLIKGADKDAVDDRGNTPLILAARAGYKDIVRLLLDSHADLAISNSEKHTALTAAALSGKVDVVDVLLEACALSTDLVSTHATLMAAVVSRGHVTVVKQLIAADLDVNHKGVDGDVPLVVAAKWGDEEMVMTLLDAGAQWDLRDDHGLTAPAVAATAGDESVLVRLFRAAGRDAVVNVREGVAAARLAARNGYDALASEMLCYLRAVVEKKQLDAKNEELRQRICEMDEEIQMLQDREELLMLMYGKAGSLKRRQRIRRQRKLKRERSEEHTTDTQQDQDKGAQPALCQIDVEELATMIEGVDNSSAEKRREVRRKKKEKKKARKMQTALNRPHSEGPESSCRTSAHTDASHTIELASEDWSQTTDEPMKVSEGEQGEDVVDEEKDDTPDHLLCPISLGLLTDPVVASDGNVYQRAALQQYIDFAKQTEKTLRSPLTGEPMDSNFLPIFRVRREAQEYLMEVQKKKHDMLS